MLHHWWFMGNSNVFNMDVFSKYSAKIYSQLQYKKSGIFSSDILIFSNDASLDLTPQLCQLVLLPTCLRVST